MSRFIIEQRLYKLPGRDRAIILLSLTGACLVAWFYLFSMAADMNMTSMEMGDMPMPDWDSGYFLMMLSMWIIMMIGMMIPSATPAILIYASIARKAGSEDNSVGATWAFVSGYLFMWVIFSLLATLLQWLLDSTALLNPMMASNNRLFGTALLVAAGIYQWLPIKDACLKHCRSPVHFIAENWRPGAPGAFTIGLKHGLFCVGCCWVLMGLLFLGGVMNLIWIAAISIFVLLEKILPWGDIGGRVMGVVMMLSGLVIAVV